MKRLTILYYIGTVGLLFPAVCWAVGHPSIIMVKQSFKEGDTFSYIVEDISKDDSGKENETKTVRRANYLLEVPRISSDGTVDIIIKKSSESLESTILNNKIDLDRGRQKQVSFKILPNGEIPEKQSINRSSIMWREIILQNLPPKGLRIGEKWKTNTPITTPLGERLRNQREFTILGFEKCKDYDCIKVKIVSKTTAEKKGVITYLLMAEKEALLAYKRGFLVVKSHRKLESKYITENKDEEMSTIRETTVELVSSKGASQIGIISPVENRVGCQN